MVPSGLRPPRAEPETIEDDITRETHGTIVDAPLPDGEPLERIRVIGREHRRTSPEDAIPPTTATLGPPPQIARWIAVGALALAGVVLLVVLLGAVL